MIRAELHSQAGKKPKASQVLVASARKQLAQETVACEVDFSRAGAGCKPSEASIRLNLTDEA